MTCARYCAGLGDPKRKVGDGPGKGGGWYGAEGFPSSDASIQIPHFCLLSSGKLSRSLSRSFFISEKGVIVFTCKGVPPK